ncbi:MAG: hypothetical protein LBC84_07995 [Prevotellaceae bacterium]|jgi:hypothetical protein|nr:hypothetical protein [Prevotellaceae bacterium]
MNKKFLFLITPLLMAGVTLFINALNNRNNEPNELLLKNVEALAFYEMGGGQTDQLAYNTGERCIAQIPPHYLPTEGEKYDCKQVDFVSICIKGCNFK